MSGRSRHGVRVWEAASPRAVVALTAGPSEAAGRFDLVARRLAEARCQVVAPDHGDSGHAEKSAGRADFRRAVADLEAVIDTQAGAHPGLPIFLLGHSLGAGIALSEAVAHQDRLAGLILSAPLVQVPPGRLKAMWDGIGAALLPDAAPMTLDPQEAARDSRTLADWFADPLIRLGPIPASTGARQARDAAAVMDDAERITVATLLLWGTQEGLHPPGGAEQLLGGLSHADLTRHTFDSQYHALLDGPARDEVLGVITAWLADHL